MGTVTLPLLFIRLILGLLITSTSISSSIASANELSLVVSPNATLRVLPGLIVEKSPGSRPGTKVLCARIEIHGLSRLKHLKKFTSSIKVKVSYVNPNGRPASVQVCFHRNMTVGTGMCPQGQWEKLSNGLWIRSMSPFDNKLLDIRLAGSAAEPLEVSLVEEFCLYRVVFLILGTVLMTLASFLSQSLVFYYSGAMAVGVLLVILMVLFQGMRLLPTGRKSSFAIFVYSSIVGLGSFILRYVPRLLQYILSEIGIDEDMYNPLAIFVVVFLVIAGAGLGFWVVRKLVLTEEGDIDVGVSHFVAWSVRIFASVMILQSSLDPLLAAEALLCGILISSVLRRFGRLKFIHRLYRLNFMIRTFSYPFQGLLPLMCWLRQEFCRFIAPFEPIEYDKHDRNTLWCSSILLLFILKPTPPAQGHLAATFDAIDFSCTAEDYADLERAIAAGNFRMNMVHLFKSHIFLSPFLEPRSLESKVPRASHIVSCWIQKHSTLPSMPLLNEENFRRMNGINLPENPQRRQWKGWFPPQNSASGL